MYIYLFSIYGNISIIGKQAAATERERLDKGRLFLFYHYTSAAARYHLSLTICPFIKTCGGNAYVTTTRAVTKAAGEFACSFTINSDDSDERPKSTAGNQSVTSHTAQ